MAPPTGRETPPPDYHLDKFGNLWLLYPRSVQPEKAKRAWRDALDRGADPEHIVAAAETYARSRAGQDPTFTPYLATWLNNGSYDDKPEPSSPPHTGNSFGPPTAPNDLSSLTDEEIASALRF